MDYLTQEDFKIARSNGISYENAYARVYNYGWEVKKAITEPIYKPNLWGQWKELATKHGISQGTFYDRVKRGMTPGEAATAPKTRGGHLNGRPAKITPEVIAQAESIGIPVGTLKRRVYFYKWTVERAMTEPVNVAKRKRSSSLLSEAGRTKGWKTSLQKRRDNLENNRVRS